MLIEKDNAAFILIDVQEKLTPLVLNSDKLIANCEWLLKYAIEVELKTLITEQYPSGLGTTVSSLRQYVSNDDIIDKVSFSCLGESPCIDKIKSLGKKQLILAGIETSVCVLQTALDARAHGYEVFVVTDSVSARIQYDHDIALKRMQQAGCQLVTKEMVFFECLRKAGSDRFKALSKSFLQA